MLSRRGCQTILVSNGREAIDILSAEKVDAVLMDIQMPVMDGIEAIQYIRSGRNPQINKDIPIIALTAHAMKGDQEKFLDAGATDYLSKPLEKDALSRVLSLCFLSEFGREIQN